MRCAQLAGVIVGIMGAFAHGAEQPLALLVEDAADPRHRGPSQARLESLQRSIENIGDLDLILSRYHEALGQIRNPEVAREVRSDLAVWQQRHRDKWVKVGGIWMAPDQVAKVRQRLAGMNERAAVLLEEEGCVEAQRIVDMVLQIDPKDPDGLYLAGLIAWRQDELVASGQCFERVLASVPDHGPSLNNMAVILQLRLQGALAWTAFRRAMAVMPQDEVIHHNVAELMHCGISYTRGGRIQGFTGEMMQEARDLFEREDAKLAAIKKKQGYVRWGSGWVTEKEREVLLTQQRLVQDRVDELGELNYQDHDRSRRLFDRSVGNFRLEATVKMRTAYVKLKDGTARPLPRKQVMDGASEPLWPEGKRFEGQANAYAREADMIHGLRPDDGYSGVFIMFPADHRPSAAARGTSTTKPAAKDQ